MSFGITISGFVAKRLADVRAELEAAYRAIYGAGIKTTPDTVIGKMIGIHADRESKLWELAEAVYNSAYPNSASGISLARIGEITDVRPNGATRSVSTVYVAGTDSAVIPVNTLIATDTAGDRFRFLTNVTIDGSQVSVDEITRSGSVATVVAYEHGLEEGGFVFIDGANQEEYNGLQAVVSVIDDDTFTFAVSGTPATPATGTIQATPGTPASVEAVRTGPVPARAGTLTQIVNPVIGWSIVSNPEDAVIGRNAETDAAFRLRRLNSLRGLGAARFEAILSSLLTVPGVFKVAVFENDSNIVVSGRPPHSIECLVVGGEDQDILDMVWNKKAAGIEAFGNVSGDSIDSQGVPHTVSFSRPTTVDIFLELDLVITDAFPDDGEQLVIDAILAYSDTLEIGQDIIVFPTLISIINPVPGIIDIDVRVGITISPTGDDNVVIGETSIARFDSSRITIATNTA